jgi:hypothetical protein
MKALIETIVERPDPSLGSSRPAWNRRKRRQQRFFAVLPERSLRFLCCLLLSLALLPKAHAVSPPPDGGYPGFNTAEGQSALLSLTTGVGNTAVGSLSLKSDTNGSFNTAVGAGTLLLNVGAQNTAVGAAALLLNTTGNLNTAVGVSALSNNGSGFQNTAIGYQALNNNTTGGDNIALGAFAGSSVTTGANNIYIGEVGGFPEEFNTIRIGATHQATYIAGIASYTVGAGTPVYIDNSGRLGVVTSSRRFKENIQGMDEASAALFSLKPVTFRYKQEFDNSGTPQFGLIAEEVEKINPALVTRDAKGDISTVRYEAVNAMLLNEFLKEHRKFEIQTRKVNDQEATIAQQQKEIQTLMASVREQSAQIQKVSARLEAGNAVSQTAFNDR